MGPRNLVLTAAATFTAAALVAATALAATPTPEPELTEPTPFPTPTADQFLVRVVEDLDNDGVEDQGEPGLGGWQIVAGCGDALQLVSTDDSGSALVFAQGSGRSDGVLQCVRLTRQFGWAPTSAPLSIPVPASIDRAKGVTFLVHHYGAAVMELSGEAIDAGLPAGNPSFTLAAPYDFEETSCVVSVQGDFRPTLIILGVDARAGCLASGATFDVLMDGKRAASATFAPAARVDQTFVINGDSMRHYSHNITSAQIDGRECGVIVEQTGFVPPGSVRVYVLSHEARAGCGAPGKLVRFFREGRPQQPLIPWTAGQVDGPTLPDLTDALPDTRPVVRLPETGSAGLR